MGWLSDLQEAMRTVDTDVALALFAQVVVWQMSGLVSDSSDRTNVTTITYDSFVDDLHLVLALLLEVFLEQSLVLLGAEVLDFALKHLVQFFEEPVVELASGVASSAWKTFLVDLSAITSEAFWQILVVSINRVEVLRSENHAAHFLFVSDHVLLASLGHGLNLGVAHDVSVESSCLRSTLVCLHGSSDFLVHGDHSVGVATKAVLDGVLTFQMLDHVPGISGLRDGWSHQSVVTATAD